MPNPDASVTMIRTKPAQPREPRRGYPAGGRTVLDGRTVDSFVDSRLSPRRSNRL